MARADRRNRTRRRRRRLVAFVAVLLVGGVAGLALTSGGAMVKAAPPTTTTSSTTTTTAPPAPPPTLFATAKSPTVNAYESAADTAKVIKDFTGLTEYQQPWTFRITEQPGNGWLHVLLPMRPNDTLGWIKESDVTVGQTAFSIKVEKAAHKVTLYNAGKVVLETQVVTGKDQTPTPEGTFFITDPVDLQSRPTGAYGAYALGLSAYSEVLMSFNGGPGQIALHGTAHADQVGQNLSNGCVRIPNDIVLKIVQTLSQPDPAVPADPTKLLGVPVDIVA